MTLKLIRGLWLLAGALVLTLLAIIPLATGMRTIAAVIVFTIVVLAWIRVGRQATQRTALTGDTCLPPAAYCQPVVLVCGDGLSGLFGSIPAEQLALRTTGQSCYLRVAGLEQLPVVAADIDTQRPGWRGQLSVMFVVNPGEHADGAVWTNQVRTLCHQIALIRKRGIALPLMLVSYVQASRAKDVWFSWEAGQTSPRVYESGACVALADWQRQSANGAMYATRLQSSVQLNNATAWLEEAVMPHFSTRGTRDPVVLTACAIALVPALPKTATGNLWQQWLHERTALVGSGQTLSGVETSLPFPDPLLPLLPVSIECSPASRASVFALWLFTVAALIALVSSAWQNNRLIRQVSDDLHRYTSIPESLHRNQRGAFAREEAVTTLRQHATRLDSHYRYGEPLGLGLGLYRGERLRVQLLDVLARHREPAPAPMKIQEPVRLNSLSLFAMGSAQLKPESTKVLINALVDIKAQPGWLIVVTGHTDATGNPEQNLQLSRDRASAVRDWMQRMGEIPDSCFAVQGFGASQPIASNDTETGRATNRRVDIRLVPEVGACVLLTAGPDRQPPSHTATFND